ncbi:hypothetical protein NKH18_38070 [Streptomyces sp. M10(2022)]
MPLRLEQELIAESTCHDHERRGETQRRVARANFWRTTLYWQAGALVTVARAVADAGDRQRAEAIARSITEPNGHEEALVCVARAVAKAGDHQQAQMTVCFITDPVRQASALREVVEAVADAGKHQQAETIARSITEPYQQAPALSYVAEAVAKAGEQTRAVRLIADALRLDKWRYSVETLVQVVPAGVKACATELETLRVNRPGPNGDSI